MSTCGSLHHIFENNPLPENPTLLESLSWSQIKPIKSIDHSSSSTSFTEIFGELYFKESPQPSPSSSSSSPSHIICTSSSSFAEIDNTKLSQKGVSSGTWDINQTPSSSSAYVSISIPITNNTVSTTQKSSDSFPSLNSESLQLCTEALGFESSDDVEDLKTGVNNNECFEIQSDEKDGAKKYCYVPSEEEDSNGECRNRSRVNEGEYPPPISCIGRTGKPWVSFRSYRKNGRFVLKEIRIPTQELLHAHREDGRLKLHFVQPDEEFLEEGEEEDDDVEGTEGKEDNTGKENDDSVTDQVKEEKEIGA